MNLVFLGPPGAGKGTQADKVCAALSIPHISTGNMLREAISKGTDTGKIAQSYMDKGALVPDELIIAIVKERIDDADCSNGFLLDGFPRTIEQAQALDKLVKLDHVIEINMSDENVIHRLTGRRVCPKCGSTYHVDLLNGSTTCHKCGAELIHRDDDDPETVKKRLVVYHAQTAPLVEYYSAENLLQRVEGILPHQELIKEIMKLLER